MAQTLDNGVTVPVNSDAWNLTTDLMTMGNSTKAVTTCVNQAARDSLSLYTGRMVWRIDLSLFEVYDGSAWQVHNCREVMADITSFSTGYTALTAGHKPRVRKIGKLVQLFGAVTSSATSTNNILTVPAAFQPPDTSTRFIGMIITSANTPQELVMASGIVQITSSGYGDLTLSKTTVQTIPLATSWWLD